VKEMPPRGLVEAKAVVLALVDMAKTARTEMDRAAAALVTATRRLEERRHRHGKGVSWDWRERRARAEDRATWARMRAAERAQRAALDVRRVTDACELAVARYAEAVRVSAAADFDTRKRLAMRVVVDVERLTDGAIVLTLACGHALALEPLVGPIRDIASCPACRRARRT